MSFLYLIHNLKEDKEYSLYTTNKIYLQQGFSIKDKYKTLARIIYQSDIENIDFSKTSEATKTINQ